MRYSNGAQTISEDYSFAALSDLLVAGPAAATTVELSKYLVEVALQLSEQAHPQHLQLQARQVLSTGKRLLTLAGQKDMQSLAVGATSVVWLHSFIASFNRETRSRKLVVDQSTDSIVLNGVEIASLRRRIVLRKLLYTFCENQGKTLSKEWLVQQVWGFEYHPLRHDATLFTNIMRLRRLLGEEGEHYVRSVEGGYAFLPPVGFVFESSGSLPADSHALAS